MIHRKASWPEVAALAELAAWFYATKQRDPSDAEAERMVDTARVMAAHGAATLH